MNNKLIVATEPTSSRTERLHPTDIGTLLARCSIKQLRVALESMQTHSVLYHTYGFIDKKGELLKEFGDSLCEESRNMKITIQEREGPLIESEDNYV